MLDRKIELLQQVPLFVGLSEEQLSAIANAGKKTYFEAGENLITIGETGSSAYLIMTGKAGCQKLEKGEALVEDLWPGTLVGELNMLVEAEHPLTVTAKERLRALAYGRDEFHALMEKHPLVAQHICERLLVRLHGLAAELHRVDSKLAEIEKAA